MKKLILFDIDGTLSDSGQAGSISLNKTFNEFFGLSEAFKHIPLDGKTDIQIVKEGLALHELQWDQSVIAAILSAYLKHLSQEIYNKRKHLKPGIVAFLTDLQKRPEIAQGLLTGNIEEGARIKLGVFDLNRFFAFGAFGSDNEDRNRLLPIAAARYREQFGQKVRLEDCIVIGDTPRDVACAKAFGAVSVAVATGNYDYEALRQTEADVVVRDLTRYMDWIQPWL